VKNNSRTPTSLRASDLFEQDKTIRTEKLRTDISGRLRKACSHLSDEDFATLVEKMVMVQIGGESRAR
jgi:hypothetical protein